MFVRNLEALGGQKIKFGLFTLYLAHPAVPMSSCFTSESDVMRSGDYAGVQFFYGKHQIPVLPPNDITVFQGETIKFSFV